MKTLEGKLLSACSMKEFLELAESKVEQTTPVHDKETGLFSGSTDELRMVDELLIALEQEANGVR